jgi:hypothetical protein
MGNALSRSFVIVSNANSAEHTGPAISLRMVPTLQMCEAIVCLIVNCVCPGVGE